MSTALQEITGGLAALVGGHGVVDDPAACAASAVDGLVPQCVVHPTSGEEVAAVLHWAAEHGLGVIPCRSATKLAIGNTPRRYDVALSLKDMNRVWYYEPADLTITAEPGMKFCNFQDFVGRQGLWLPLDPPGGGRASLGGIVATNAAGPLRLAYGAPRDMVLGMKVATTEGKVFKAGGRVVKNVTGYDIGKLLIGSFGTLGVVVETTFKLFPQPPERVSFALKAGTLGIARDLRRRILASANTPARCVLLVGNAAHLATGQPATAESAEPELRLELHGSTRRIERAKRDLESLAQAVGAKAEVVEPAQAESAWARLTDVESWDSKDFALVLKATLPDAASEELVSRAVQEAEGEKAQCVAVAQLGVGIVRIGLLSALTVEAQTGLIRRLRAATEALGGRLIIERCPPAIKEQFDVWGEPGSDFALMNKMKQVWDPKGTLSPGRFLGHV